MRWDLRRTKKMSKIMIAIHIKTNKYDYKCLMSAVVSPIVVVVLLLLFDIFSNFGTM